MITVKKDGTADYTKIQDALDAVDTSSPAIVEVQDSETYSEILQIGSNVELRSATAHKPTLTFPSDIELTDTDFHKSIVRFYNLDTSTGVSNSSITGFNIDNARLKVIPQGQNFAGKFKQQYSGAVIDVRYSQNIIVENCSIYNSFIIGLGSGNLSPYHGQNAGGNAYIFTLTQAQNVLIQNNEFYALPNGINLYQTSGIKVYGNLFHNFCKHDNRIITVTGGTSSAPNEIIGNTFTGVVTALNCPYPSGDQTIVNNIIVSSSSQNMWDYTLDPASDVHFAGSGTNFDLSKFHYNCFGSFDINNTSAGSGTPGSGNITADPQFTDAANLDFTLSPSSPCIDAGDDVSVYYTSGINGVPLPAGSGWDMGAFEYADIIKPIITLLGAAGELDPHNIVIIAGDENSPYVYDDNGILTYIDSGATAFDNVDGDITNQIQVSGDIVNVLSPGLYHIYFNVSDAAGNSADTAIRTVQVSQSSAGKVFLRLISLGTN